MKMENLERSLLVRVPDDGPLSSKKCNVSLVFAICRIIVSLNLQIIHLIDAARDEQVALLFHAVPPDGSYPIRVSFQFE